jgi:hypothetical protein
VTVTIPTNATSCVCPECETEQLANLALEQMSH